MEDHTYFVGKHGVLVHNACDGFGDNPFNQKAKSFGEEYTSTTGKMYANGYEGEKALAEMVGGERQVYRRTSLGGRFIDQMADGIAHESKVGRVSLTKM